MSDTEIRKPLLSLFGGLHQRFASNLQAALTSESALLLKAERKARMISEVATLLGSSQGRTKTQIEILSIFEEVFADVVSSMYLASVALDNPAKMLLRRAFELGLATVYLWDMPHLYWKWKSHDSDLNFRDMVDHLASPTYSTFVLADCHTYKGELLLDAAIANKLYRKMSNVVHGKIADFESNSPQRFAYVPEEWKEHLLLTCSVEDILLKIWRLRFEAVGTNWMNSQVEFES